MTDKKLPIIYTAHHASHNFGKFSDRCALSDEQRVRFSDYGTDLTVPQNGTVLENEFSRGLGDPNRVDDGTPYIFPLQDFARPVRNNVWKEGQEPTPEEQKVMREDVYNAFHNRIRHAITAQTEPTLVVSWDNTAPYIIGENESGQPQEMKLFILSNRGPEGSAYPSDDPADPVSCDPALLLKVAELLASKAPTFGFEPDIHLNLVFQGGCITQSYSTLRHKDLGVSFPVQSFQLEYSTVLTHNQETLEPDMVAIKNLRTCFEQVMEEAYDWWVDSLQH